MRPTGALDDDAASPVVSARDSFTLRSRTADNLYLNNSVLSASRLCWLFLSASVFGAEHEIMAAQHHAAPKFLAQGINDVSQPLLGVMLPGGDIKGQPAP